MEIRDLRVDFSSRSTGGGILLTYELQSGEVVVRQSDGRVRWRGQPDGFPARAIVPLADSDDAVVLFDYIAGPKNFANLVRITRDGHVVWRMNPPEPSMPDAWVEFEWVGEDLYVNSWSGYRVRVDLTTGKPSASEFVK